MIDLLLILLDYLHMFASICGWQLQRLFLNSCRSVGLSVGLSVTLSFWMAFSAFLSQFKKLQNYKNYKKKLQEKITEIKKLTKFKHWVGQDHLRVGRDHLQVSRDQLQKSELAILVPRKRDITGNIKLAFKKTNYRSWNYLCVIPILLSLIIIVSHFPSVSLSVCLI